MAHDALLVIGPLVTAAWAMRSNRQHKNNEKKVDSLTNGGLRNAVLAALREHEAGKAESQPELVVIDPREPPDA